MFNLVPDEGSDIPYLPDNNAEITREAATTVDLKGDWTIPAKAITVMRIKTGKFTVNVSINTLRPAQKLVVTFQGARAGGKETTSAMRPMFARRNYEALFEAPILAISDPMTEIDWNSNVPRCGFYMGTLEDDLVPELNAMIDVFCAKLGVPVDNVTMYGSSAGGTSAILVGSRRTSKTGIVAVCPFLRPDKYREGVVAAGMRAIGKTMDDYEEMMQTTPWRFNALTALKRPGHPPGGGPERQGRDDHQPSFPGPVAPLGHRSRRWRVAGRPCDDADVQLRRSRPRPRADRAVGSAVEARRRVLRRPDQAHAEEGRQEEGRSRR
jgi:hypothetical protein